MTMKIGDTVKIFNPEERQAYMTLLHSQGYIGKFSQSAMEIRVVGYTVQSNEPQPKDFDDMQRVGARIKKLRNNFMYSQCELAEALGCDRRRIANWEAGRSIPTNTEIDTLEDLFFTTRAYILKGVGNGQTAEGL